MATGPPPSRLRARARSIASYTAKKSAPSTFSAGMPKPRARAAISFEPTAYDDPGVLAVAVVLEHEDRGRL